MNTLSYSSCYFLHLLNPGGCSCCGGGGGGRRGAGDDNDILACWIPPGLPDPLASISFPRAPAGTSWYPRGWPVRSLGGYPRVPVGTRRVPCGGTVPAGDPQDPWVSIHRVLPGTVPIAPPADPLCPRLAFYPWVTRELPLAIMGCFLVPYPRLHPGYPLCAPWYLRVTLGPHG